jgi:hypothetical protein
VQSDIKHFPFSVIERKSKPTIVINVGSEQKFFTPEEISAMVLGKMREIAVRIVFLLLPFMFLSFVRNHILVIKLLMLLLPFLRISILLNVKLLKMLEPSLV